MNLSSGPIRTIRLALVRRRTPLTALANTISAFSLAGYFGLTTTPNAPVWWRWVLLGTFFVTNSLIVFLTIAPQYYERAQYLESLLPVIHQVLQLDTTSRVTIHHINSRKREKYEQIIPYYPTSIGQGRKFPFSQGITGQVFRTRTPRAYSIPTGLALAEDYKTRWNFTDDETTRVTQDRRSFLAYPIGQHGGFARAVLYFDSADQSMFDPSTAQSLTELIERLFLPTLERALGTDQHTF